jgi:hypothetical protein
MLTHALPVAAPPLVAIRVLPDGKVEIACHVPKLEAVKLLNNVIEELRLQAFREQDRMVLMAQPASR